MKIIRRLVWKTDQRNSKKHEGGQWDGVDNFLEVSDARVDNQEAYNHVE